MRERRPIFSARRSLAELEHELIERVLADEAGNKTRAAQRLGLDRKTLYRKPDEYAKQDGRESPPWLSQPGED